MQSFDLLDPNTGERVKLSREQYEALGFGAGVYGDQFSTQDDKSMVTCKDSKTGRILEFDAKHYYEVLAIQRKPRYHLHTEPAPKVSPKASKKTSVKKSIKEKS